MRYHFLQLITGRTSHSVQSLLHSLIIAILYFSADHSLKMNQVIYEHCILFNPQMSIPHSICCILKTYSSEKLSGSTQLHLIRSKKTSSCLDTRRSDHSNVLSTGLTAIDFNASETNSCPHQLTLATDSTKLQV